MNIFKEETIELSEAEVRAKQITSLNAHSLRKLEQAIRTNFNSIWSDDDLTPQEILDEFGTDAKDLFVASQATQAFIQQFNPDFEPLVTPYEFTINTDGTVTVGDKIEVTEI